MRRLGAYLTQVAARGVVTIILAIYNRAGSPIMDRSGSIITMRS